MCAGGTCIHFFFVIQCAHFSIFLKKPCTSIDAPPKEPTEKPIPDTCSANPNAKERKPSRRPSSIYRTGEQIVLFPTGRRRQTADGSRGVPAPLASAANCRLLSAVSFPFSEMSKQAFSPRVQYITPWGEKTCEAIHFALKHQKRLKELEMVADLHKIGDAITLAP